MNKKTCIIISGPTAVGKTSFGIELALQHNTHIISADSRQCFKELNIGVAKPSAAELLKVKHHFIDTLSIQEEVNAKIFEAYALQAVNEIFKNKDIAVMVGGTGLYIKAFTEGLDEIPGINQNIRKDIKARYDEEGIQWLQREVASKDPDFFSQKEIENPQRLMRALEVKLSTGRSILAFQSGRKVKRNFDIKHISLQLPREQLYNNINQRVDMMMEAGLLHEAESLFPYRHLNALQTVGYKEIFRYMEGEFSLSQAVEEIKKNTRRFAKRQITWFNQQRENTWDTSG